MAMNKCKKISYTPGVGLGQTPAGQLLICEDRRRPRKDLNVAHFPFVPDWEIGTRHRCILQIKNAKRPGYRGYCYYILQPKKISCYIWRKHKSAAPMVVLTPIIASNKKQEV